MKEETLSGVDEMIIRAVLVQMRGIDWGQIDILSATRSEHSGGECGPELLVKENDLCLGHIA